MRQLSIVSRISPFIYYSTGNDDYIYIQMKFSSSKEKLDQMHEVLDRELQMIAPNNRREREELRLSSGLNEQRRKGRPVVYDHCVRDIDISGKRNEIMDLERKMKELDRRMDGISGIDDDSEDEELQKVVVAGQRGSLNFKEKNVERNEDTARFLLGEGVREKEKTKNLYSYPSLQDQSEQDSDEDDLIRQRLEKKRQSSRNNSRDLPKITENPVQLGLTALQQTDRKISLESEGVLRPKYSNQKSLSKNKQKASKSKKNSNSIKDSVTSKKSIQKVNLNRANSKDSLRSKGHSKHVSRQKSDRSFSRFSDRKQDNFHVEQVQLAKQAKRTANLQKQLSHYKRLAHKYKDQLQQYRIMQIEFKQLKKNFAKSELIRTQQKKIIQGFKSKMTKNG